MSASGSGVVFLEVFVQKHLVVCQGISSREVIGINVIGMLSGNSPPLLLSIGAMISVPHAMNLLQVINCLVNGMRMYSLLNLLPVSEQIHSPRGVGLVRSSILALMG